MRYIVVSLALSVALSGQASAATFVVCTSPDKPEIVLEIGAEHFEGKTLSCLSGGDFVVDMTPCAPDGGYGLSAPTGSASLVGVVDRWQDYGSHMGGVVSFSSSASSYGFQGGFMYPESGYQDAWRFEVSRLTGRGELSIVQEVEEGGQVGWSNEEYDCKQVARKF